MKKLILFSTLILASFGSQAQFDKKFTFDLGAGYAIPYGEPLREDNVPHFYSNLLGGISFMGQAQYNLTKKIALGLKVEYSGFSYWYDPRTANSDSYDSYMNVFNVSPIIKYRILNSKFSPYLIGGLGAGIYNGERTSTNILVDDFFPAGPDDSFASIDYVILREAGIVINNDIRLSSFLGLGLEYEISQSLGIFALGSYQIINSQNNETLRQNIQYLTLSAGVNLNFVKSKTF